MKRSILQAVCAMALCAAFLLAQTTTTTTTPTPPTPAQVAADMVARLTTLLDLTASQQATALTIFTAEATTNQALATQMQTAQTALQTAITANSTSGITTAATTIGGLTTKQVVSDATADASFYAILTTAQQTKYTTLQPLGGGPGFGAGGPPAGGGGGGGGGRGPGH